MSRENRNACNVSTAAACGGSVGRGDFAARVFGRIFGTGEQFSEINNRLPGELGGLRLIPAMPALVRASEGQMKT